jgi:site-specific DNA-methyltransferase (adenine-specific)
MKTNVVYNMDCLTGMKFFVEDKSVNMIFTSPPYAEQRRTLYEGTLAEEYSNWFMQFIPQFERILKDDGSLFINIKEHSINGFKSEYVLELILNIIRYSHFKLVDTLCWTKQAYPRGVINSFKNAWEPVYHFAKQKDIKIRPQSVAEPIKDETLKRAKRKQVGLAESGSGYSQPNLETIGKMTTAFPSNHIHIPNVVNQFSKNKWHPATFPVKLPEWFVKAFTDEGDLVLDPFCGSGTTCLAAKNLGRHYLGFELSYEYCQGIKDFVGLEVSNG